MNKINKFGLCLGRHEIKGINEYIFPNELDPLNLAEMEKLATEKLQGVEKLDLYVTGLTVALVSVINVCKELGIELTLFHFNRESGEYYPQKVKQWNQETKKQGKNSWPLCRTVMMKE